MGHLLFVTLLSVCISVSIHFASFCKYRDVGPQSIPVDFFPVFADNFVGTADHQSFLHDVPHICTVSLLKRMAKFRHFQSSRKLIYLNIFVVIIGNAYNPGPTSLNGASRYPCGYVMPVLVGKTMELSVTRVTSGIILTARVCRRLCITFIIGQ